MAKAKKERAALLCRVSTPQQTEKGLESQVACLKAKAIEDGYEVPTNLIFQEQISGLDRNKEIRQSLKELMDAAEKNQVDVVYVYELTRISRDPYNLTSRIQWFSDRGIPMFIYEVELWTLDRETKQELTETTEYIFGAATFGQKEAEKIRKRMMRGKSAAAEQGYYTGHLADGYMTEMAGKHKRIVIDPERSKIIKLIFDWFINGKSSDEIAQRLNAMKIPTTNNYRLNSPHFNYREKYKKGGDELERTNAEWQGSNVVQIISNRWYVGERKFSGQTYSVDAIITSQEWEKAVEMRAKRSENFRSQNKSRKHLFLLSGLLYCGVCFRKMYGHFTGKNNHYYCSSAETGNKCGLKGACKENIEAIVLDIIRWRSIISVYGSDLPMPTNIQIQPNNLEDQLCNYFTLSDKEQKQIKLNIRTLTADNERLQGKIERSNKRIGTYFEQMADHEDLTEVLESNIEKEQRDKKKFDEQIVVNTSQINLLKRRLNAGKNIDKIVNAIEDERNLNVWRSLIEQVVERIELFNVDVSISLLKILYVNGKEDICIYSPRLIPNGYLRIIHETAIMERIKFNHLSNSIDFGKGRSLILYELQIEDGSFRRSDVGKIDDEAARIKGVGGDIVNVSIVGELKESVTVREYVLLMRQGHIYTYDRSMFEADEERERARKQREREKEYQAKRNTGLPTVLPSVVADEAYEDYLKKRKHLYNRKWKIQKNKSLNEKEKRQRLEEIDLQLQILKSRVKHLSREEQVKIYLSKKKHESK